MFLRQAIELYNIDKFSAIEKERVWPFYSLYKRFFNSKDLFYVIFGEGIQVLKLDIIE